MISRRVGVSVVIPTYREAMNLSVLIPRLSAALRRAGLAAEIIVVDDFSDDGTDLLCASLSQDFPVRLLTRYEERGLASAVLLGLKESNGDILVVMDADMSHPPETVPNLVSACRSRKADFVIGSRYVAGASFETAWPWHRCLHSRVASLVARGLTNARDPLAGFFAIKRSSLRTTAIEPSGDNIALEMIVRCDLRRIVEVPIAYRDRVFGESNQSITKQWSDLRQLTSLYQAKYVALIHLCYFSLTGLSGTLLDLTVFSLLLLRWTLIFSRMAASAIGAAAGAATKLVLSRQSVHEHRTTHLVIGQEQTSMPSAVRRVAA
jgi:dolichol-phosphate mannosyltransferase